MGNRKAQPKPKKSRLLAGFGAVKPINRPEDFRKMRAAVEEEIGERNSVVRPLHALAARVWFEADMIHVRLADGREISVPLEWFSALREATETQRNNWRLIGNGVGIHWEDLDEDISVAALLEA